MKGASERLEREQRERAWLAWHIASLPLQKKFPSEKDFIFGGEKKRDPRRKSPDELRVIAQQWHAQISGMKR
jgi:hypothetical protein